MFREEVQAKPQAHVAWRRSQWAQPLVWAYSLAPQVISQASWPIAARSAPVMSGVP
jgi:hypothetical protein